MWDGVNPCRYQLRRSGYFFCCKKVPDKCPPYHDAFQVKIDIKLVGHHAMKPVIFNPPFSCQG